MLTIVICAVLSFLVAYVTAKRCLDKIDGYVQDMISDLEAALEDFIRRWDDPRSR